MVLGNDNVVRNCEITDVGLGAMFQGTGNLFTRNYVHHLGKMIMENPDSSDPNAQGGAEGVMVMGNDTEISYNRFVLCKATTSSQAVGGEDGGATEVVVPQAGGTVSGLRVHHNYSEQNVGFFEASSMAGSTKSLLRDAVFSYNVIVDSKWMFLLQTNNTLFEGVEYENNTVIYTEASLQGISGAMMLGTFFGDGASVLVPGAVSLTNNIIVYPSGATVYGGGFNGADSIALVLQHNLFSSSNLPLGSGVTADASNLRAEDPGLVDTAGRDYHLVSTSPAIDQGLALGHVLDFDNHDVPAGVAPDIGAYEFGSTMSTNEPGVGGFPGIGGAPNGAGAQASGGSSQGQDAGNGLTTSGDASGCGCRLGSRRAKDSALAALAVLAAGLRRRRLGAKGRPQAASI
jgi:hypothetical protein